MKKHLSVLQLSLLQPIIPPVYAESPLNIGPPREGWQGILNWLQTVLDFVAVAFVTVAIMLFIYSAFLFLTARGDEEKIKRAKSNLIWALIGVVVALFSFGIFRFVLTLIAPSA